MTRTEASCGTHGFVRRTSRWRPGPNYRVGDTLTTVRVLSAPWHACDGSTFDQTAYPALYAVLGGTTLPTISYSSDTTTYIKMADD